MMKVILMTVLLICVLQCVEKIGKNYHSYTTLKEQELQQVLNYNTPSPPLDIKGLTVEFSF
jgi:hypothetical protein